MANGASLAKNEPSAPSFWRDDALPFIEARSIEDGRSVGYGKHAHATFSIGAVTGGESTYLNGRAVERIGAGAVVVINPEQVHACNPLDNRLWAYRMIYADVVWLGELQRDLGMHQGGDFHAFSTTLTTSPALYHGLNCLYAILGDADSDMLQRHSAVVHFFAQVHRRLNRAPVLKTAENRRLARAADYIKDNCQRSLLLDEICAAADLSASYLIRAFKLRYGMTPHAYLMNSRIEYSRAQLRRGRAIAEVAAEAGFADQAHLQRTFRKFVAATPGQYRG